MVVAFYQILQGLEGTFDKACSIEIVRVLGAVQTTSAGDLKAAGSVLAVSSIAKSNRIQSKNPLMSSAAAS